MVWSFKNICEKDHFFLVFNYVKNLPIALMLLIFHEEKESYFQFQKENFGSYLLLSMLMHRGSISPQKIIDVSEQVKCVERE